MRGHSQSPTLDAIHYRLGGTGAAEPSTPADQGSTQCVSAMVVIGVRPHVCARELRLGAA